MSDTSSYQNWLSAKERDWEGLCRNCGACCGAFDDPCLQLATTPEGKSFCRTYATRLGPQKTISGKAFNCVPVRQKLGSSWPGDERCPYKNISTFYA